MSTGVSEDQQRVEDGVVEQVLASLSQCPDPRLKHLVERLVVHLHDYLREVRPTEAEWGAAIAFLTAAGHLTTDTRQEFVLLSDVLGASMQTIAVNNEASGNATEATVLGPFFTEDAPLIGPGGDIAGGAQGEPCWVEGTVTDTAGRPVPGARIEVWQADADGCYDVQYPDARTAGRGHLFTDSDGGYAFWALTPTAYPIPSDGPVGHLLERLGRSPVRAPHLHFMVRAEGLRTLVTHIFVAGDSHLDSDSVFGVKRSLVVDFPRHPADAPTPDGRRVDGPTWTRTRFDIVLAPGRPD